LSNNGESQCGFVALLDYSSVSRAGPSRWGPNARPGRGAPLRSDFMTSSCSVNGVTIVVERRYAVQH